MQNNFEAHPGGAATTEVHSVDGALLEKLKVVQEELGARDLDTALDRVLNIAHFVAETLADPKSKLLIERNGKYQRLLEFT